MSSFQFIFVNLAYLNLWGCVLNCLGVWMLDLGGGGDWLILVGLLLSQERKFHCHPFSTYLFQPGRADLPKIHDLAANVRVLVTQGISVNSSYSSDVQVCLCSCNQQTQRICPQSFDRLLCLNLGTFFIDLSKKMNLALIFLKPFSKCGNQVNLLVT